MDNKRNNNNNDKKININDDYIELLSYVKKKDDYEDIYSFSSRDNDEFEDIFSDSSKEDVYISKNKRKPVEDDNIYINRNRTVSNERRYNKDDFSVEIPVAPPPMPKKKRMQDTDEISDFEERRGKRVPEKKKESKKNKVLAIVLAVILAFGGILFMMANSVVGKFEKAEKIQHVEGVELVSDKNVKNILLIGADKEKGGASRSDSIMIASVNKNTGRITVCSILRDTHLYIPGKQEAKVNAAYAWGGANLLVQTIEHNFGIKIDDYATVNFEMFTALIDGLGGIEVEVTEDEADYINNRHSYGKEKKPDAVESGESVQLNGYQALWYARIRKLDSDFMRTQRQRKVMSSIASKIKGQMNPIGIFGLVSTAKDVAPYIETTLSAGDFWSLIFAISGCFTKSIGSDELLVSQQLPFDDTWWYSTQWDGSSISINVEQNKQMLYDLLYGEPVEEETETAEESTSETE